MHFYCSLWKASSQKENICVKQRHARKKGLALHSKWTDVIVKKTWFTRSALRREGETESICKIFSFPKYPSFWGHSLNMGCLCQNRVEKFLSPVFACATGRPRFYNLKLVDKQWCGIFCSKVNQLRELKKKLHFAKTLEMRIKEENFLRFFHHIIVPLLSGY